MAQPTEYERQYSFTDYQTANPADPLPGNQVDAELNAAKQTLDQILANLELIQRDDGAIANNSVGSDQLKDEVDFGFNTITDWAPGVEYVLRDGVWHENNLYRCVIAHTSTVFATDLAADKWVLLVDFATPLDGAAASAAAASASATSAAASYDSFDDRYLGSKTSNPTLDNDGNALLTGALYWNSVTTRMKVYTGSAWIDASAIASTITYYYVATAAQTTFSGADQNTLTLAYTVGLIEVFLNGARLIPGVDYTASDGTSVVLASGASVSDTLLITAYTAYSLVGAITATGLTLTGDALISGAFTQIGVFTQIDSSGTGTNFTITNGGSFNVSVFGAGGANLSGTNILLDASTSVTLEGGDSTISMTGSGITFNGDAIFLQPTGNIVVGDAAIATNATTKLLWVPSCAGAATGAATAPYTNAAAIVYDSTNNKIYVRCGGTWRSTAALT